MIKENITIDKYTIYNDMEDAYDIFVIPEVDNNMNHSMNFYIQKKGYGCMAHTIGLLPEDFEKLDVENFIKENTNEWIEICEDDIRILES